MGSLTFAELEVRLVGSDAALALGVFRLAPAGAQHDPSSAVGGSAEVRTSRPLLRLRMGMAGGMMSFNSCERREHVRAESRGLAKNRPAMNS